MTAGRTRTPRGRKVAVLAALASVLLASCSTSDTDVPFGFAASGPVGLATIASDLTPADASDAASEVADADTASAFVMDENDPNLPQAVAFAPSIRPGSEAVQAAEAAVPPVTSLADATLPVPSPAQQQASAAPAADPVPEPTAAPAQAQQTDAQAVAFAPVEPRKRGFLSSLFGGQSANAAAAPAPQKPASRPTPVQQAAEPQAAPAKPIIQLASTGPAAKPLVASSAATGAVLPGVRQEGLFEISRRSGLDDDSDIDLYEDEAPSYQVASAAGLARLAPNGLVKQTDHVDVACLKPSLVRVLKTVEKHYGRQVVVTSGYRGSERNKRARGARNSLHMYCAAADIQVAGVSKWDLAQYVRTMPGRGGVGTYCHTESVHIDVGPERDWNWRCRRRK